MAFRTAGYRIQVRHISLRLWDYHVVLWASVIWKQKMLKKKVLQIMSKASQQAAFCSIVTVTVLTFKVIAL